MKWLLTLCFALLAAGALDASTASASTLFYSFSEFIPGGITFSFEQSSNPTPISYVDGLYTEVPISNATGAIAGLTAFDWYSSSGGYAQFAYSPQGYSGPESAPVFAPGTFISPPDQNGDTGLLIATVIATPEPATWAMLLLGFFGVGAMMRSARRNSLNAP